MARPKLFDGEQVIDVYKPARAFEDETILLTEQALTDISKVYNVLLGNVRFEFIDKQHAQEFIDHIRQEIKTHNMTYGIY